MKHLSELDLDRIASDLGPVEGALRTHVAGCATCEARLEGRRRDAARIRQLPGFAQGMDRLDRVARAPRRPPLRWLLWLVPVATAAGVALVVMRPSPPEDRLKGQAAIRLVDPQGRPLEAQVPVGSTVRLAVDPQGHRHGLVVALEGDRPVVLWPPASTPEAPLPAGVIAQTFRVTPGSLELFLFAGDAPLSADEARAAVEAAVADCARPLAPGCAAPASLTGERARARALYVGN